MIIIIIAIIVITCFQYMKQFKRYKWNKNGLFQKLKKKLINLWKLINISKTNGRYILNIGNKVDIDYREKA